MSTWSRLLCSIFGHKRLYHDITYENVVEGKWDWNCSRCGKYIVDNQKPRGVR